MKNRGKRIVIGLVVGVLVATVIVCTAVPQVRETIKYYIGKLAKEGNGKTDQERIQEIVYNDEFYTTLGEDEKKAFDNKLNDIVNSDYYKNLDDEEKDKLIDKFVESEKTIKEVSQDPKDKKPEEIENKISDKQNELVNVQKEIEDLKNSGASEEEIVKAEEKQQQIEKQIKEAAQEKAYWETVETVKRSIPIAYLYGTQNSNVQVRRINSIYSSGFLVYVNADMIRDEFIDGRLYKSQQNAYITFSVEDIIDHNTILYSDVLKMIKETDIVSVNSPCINKNQQSHKDYFLTNKNNISKYVVLFESQGCNLEVEDSWETKDSTKPSFLIKADDGTTETMLYLIYDQSCERYLTSILHKICPEFWAQIELSRS